MKRSELIKKLVYARRKLVPSYPLARKLATEEEGGCGVVGFICNIPIGGKHIFYPSIQMHNRGNGKGGGIAAVGLSAETLGVSQEILDNDYLYQIALLDPGVQGQLESEFIEPFFNIDKAQRVETVGDYRDVGLEVRPPDVMQYFVRVKPGVLEEFISENHLEGIDPRRAEDEFVYQNSFKLNQKYYSSLGEKKAFVLSRGRNMCIFKIVGYAEQVVQYYQLENFKAHVWIAHQRYPTKGKVWHPAGAHPFAGLDEALVHNGDFANYFSVAQYLRQHNVFPLFLTDTEVAILLFDLLNRTYGYPLEYIIEAIAPTTELDFDFLPPEKQHIYRALHASHIHGSPDGPWFFIIARNEFYQKYYQLIGITDTAMLRPQVFALYDGGEVQVGLIASEKQAIDATLRSLSEEDKRFCPVADKYWNARGGSHTDGGTFIFTLKKGDAQRLVCTDKFGKEVRVPLNQRPWEVNIPEFQETSLLKQLKKQIEHSLPLDVFRQFVSEIPGLGYEEFYNICSGLAQMATEDDVTKEWVIEFLTLLNDRYYDTGEKKRSWLLWIVSENLKRILGGVVPIGSEEISRYKYIDWQNRKDLRPPRPGEEILVINAWDFPPEGDECDARLICEAYFKGWRRFIAYNYRGQRFCGCGLGPKTNGVRIDVYGSSGDYLGSGLDGLEVYVHGNAQDQVGQILNAGKIVIFGDVGQTFLYGAKGGEAYVLGNAAGRPLINAVGCPRVVINGTALDYLAESFMAGDPLKGGGFCILNGITFDERGRLKELPTPYPGSNLFSLASGGAIYVRDPHRKLVEEQLNGGVFTNLTEADWELILPYLEENERLFGIRVDELLTVDGEKRRPEDVYRKVKAVRLKVLAGQGIPE